MDIITSQQLEELRLKAKGGKQDKKIKYANAKRQFEELKNSLFDGENYVYMASPSDDYIKQLEDELNRAKDETEKELMEARLKLIQANKSEREANKSGEAGRQFKLDREAVAKKAKNNEKVTRKDLEQAQKVAARNPSPYNRANYSNLKRRFENQTQEGAE